MPAEAFAKIIGGEMIWVVAGGHNRFIRLAFRREIVIHADQDDLLKAHIECKLQSNIGDRRAFPNAARHIVSKLWTGICGVQKHQLVRKSFEVTMRMPCNEFWNRERGNFVRTLLDHKIVDGNKIGCSKTQFGKQ